MRISCSKSVPFSDLININTGAAGEIVDKNDDEEENRLPLSEHLWEIVKLCGKQWRWFVPAYTLLILDCACECLRINSVLTVVSTMQNK